MLFNSFQFIVFFIGVLLLYHIAPKKLRCILLLIASYLFYMAWNVKYIFLLLGITVSTYLCAVWIDKLAESPKKHRAAEKLVLTASIAVNLGLLVYFKYMDFFASTIYRALDLLHIQVSEPHFDILLPVGISFITFQALGYTIDVYRGRLKAEKNLLKYALFMSFFPQLVAGPIERSENLLKQIQTVHLQKRVSYDKFTKGLMLMLFGYFQKVFLADKLAILVNTVFSSPGQYSTIELALGAVAFSLQIYCDFGGYSNIAIGAGQVLGFHMMENFNAPYLASSIKDFWRRWHISLSSWFRDYLYIPLGGNRCGKLRKYVNLMTTFLVSGLWHGANMHFVVWGGLHGLLQIAESEGKSLLQKTRLKINTNTVLIRSLRILATYFLITVTWIFFRANSVSAALAYIARMFTSFRLGALFDGSIFQLGLCEIDLLSLCFGVVVLFLTDLLRYTKGIRIEEFLHTRKLWFKWSVLLIFIVCILIFGEYGINYDSAEFIYFQF